MKFITVLITAPDQRTAEDISNAIVEEKLAACVNIMTGLRSIYRWQGKIENSTEVLMIAKTRNELFRALEKRVKELHPYEVPEIIALVIEDASAEYMTWLSESTDRAEWP